MQLQGHFACEQFGQNPENPVPCDRNDFRELAYPEATAVALLCSAGLAAHCESCVCSQRERIEGKVCQLLPKSEAVYQ